MLETFHAKPPIPASTRSDNLRWTNSLARFRIQDLSADGVVVQGAFHEASEVGQLHDLGERTADLESEKVFPLPLQALTHSR